MLKKKLKALAIAGTFASVATLSAGGVSAATCPPAGDPGTRIISLDAATGTSATVSCAAYGDGNIGSTPDNAALFIELGVSGLMEVDDSGDGDTDFISGTLGSGTSGQVTVSASILSAFENLFIGLKFGNGGFTPDWAVFSISGAGTFDWSSDQNQALSHTVLYGTAVSAVPLPAAGLLLLAGIGGLVAIRRQKISA